MYRTRINLLAGAAASACRHRAVLILLALLAAALPLAASRAVLAATGAGSISVETPWSRETPGGASVAAGYMTIKNSGTGPDRLISASSDIAGKAEIHQMSMDGGVMRMRQLPDGVAIPAKGEVVFDPNSYHLMFLDLKHPLTQGETFSTTLNFEKAGPLQATFTVEGVGAMAPGKPKPGMQMSPGMQMGH